MQPRGACCCERPLVLSVLPASVSSMSALAPCHCFEQALSDTCRSRPQRHFFQKNFQANYIFSLFFFPLSKPPYIQISGLLGVARARLKTVFALPPLIRCAPSRQTSPIVSPHRSSYFFLLAHFPFITAAWPTTQTRKTRPPGY